MSQNRYDLSRENLDLVKFNNLDLAKFNYLDLAKSQDQPLKIHNNEEEDNTLGGATHPQPNYPVHQATTEHPNKIIE